MPNQLIKDSRTIITQQPPVTVFIPAVVSNFYIDSAVTISVLNQVSAIVGETIEDIKTQPNCDPSGSSCVIDDAKNIGTYSGTSQTVTFRV